MKPQEMQELGIDAGALNEAHAVIKMYRAFGLPVSMIKVMLKDIAKNPDDKNVVGEFPERVALAKKLIDLRDDPHVYRERESPAPYRVWGVIDIEMEAIDQLKTACRLPSTHRAALMPDAHRGYGLPIGGVLATKGTVIPHAVGVDIACRMCFTVTDLPVSMLDTARDKLTKSIERNTRFGMGAAFNRKRNHDVMDEDWSISPVTKKTHEKAWAQLGSSGGGNHFVEFGTFTYKDISGNEFLALMSHSGSRGTGMAVAKHYSKIAEDRCRGLPKGMKDLAWLTLDSEAGQEYWAAMELMGRYASASHELIHDSILRTLGAEHLYRVENHHNFAWKETHDGQDVVIHRKGATPAHKGVQGVIPGSMGTPAYLVKGLGSEDSLYSASHGAGRRMSRTEAKKRFSQGEMDAFLAGANVTLISAGLDECPQAYKDIHSVMDDQSDLVEIQGTFNPRLVKMAPEQKRRWRK